MSEIDYKALAEPDNQPEDVTDCKWLDPECGTKGCQSLALKSLYETAVKGRQDFRQAYQEARAKQDEYFLQWQNLRLRGAKDWQSRAEAAEKDRDNWMARWHDNCLVADAAYDRADRLQEKLTQAEQIVAEGGAIITGLVEERDEADDQVCLLVKEKAAYNRALVAMTKERDALAEALGVARNYVNTLSNVYSEPGASKARADLRKIDDVLQQKPKWGDQLRYGEF
jgi:hypothetical protein